ncbi:MAG: hypothetical protein KAY32_10290 [Candidatus Eisenbacteria sp.]|nr:hypothetical protein [Candidatus Eisenbacteria bacterium]
MICFGLLLWIGFGDPAAGSRVAEPASAGRLVRLQGTETMGYGIDGPESSVTLVAPPVGVLGGREGWGVAPELAQAAQPRFTIGGRGPERRRASRVRAIGASLLLPGLGQRANGYHGRARVYWVAEAAIWVGFVASRVQGRVRKEGYIEYAETYAGIADAGGHSDGFYRNLGNHSSSESYRQEVARDARALYGDDLAQREIYIQEIMGGLPAWEWRSLSAQIEYGDRRKDSRNAYRRASLFLGAALLNRLVSAVDAAWLAVKRGDEAGADRAGGGRLFYQPEEDGAGYLCLQWIL